MYITALFFILVGGERDLIFCMHNISCTSWVPVHDHWSCIFIPHTTWPFCLQDIVLGNILMNQFTHSSKSSYWDVEARHSLCMEGWICYSLFDFDLSHIFPLDTPIGDCYLPTTCVQGRGAPWLHPKEVNNVNQDLDPFKFDIACMGNMLSRYNVCLFYDHMWSPKC